VSSQPLCKECTSYSRPLNVDEEGSPTTEGKQCAWQGCKIVVGIYNMSTSIYCAKHAMEKRFERAMGQKQAPAPPPESKSFKKARLHPINQEGKKILKEHKPHRDQGHMDSSVGNRRAMVKKPETPVQKSRVARKSAPTRNVSNDMTITHHLPQRKALPPWATSMVITSRRTIYSCTKMHPCRLLLTARGSPLHPSRLHFTCPRRRK
jgi:hypothetical protein